MHLDRLPEILRKEAIIALMLKLTILLTHGWRYLNIK